MSKNLKVMIVLIGSLDVGGTERHLMRVLPSLQCSGWRVTVLPWWRRGTLFNSLQAEGVGVIPPWAELAPQFLGPFGKIVRIFLASMQVAFYIFRYRRAIISLYLPHSYWIGAFWAIIFGCKRIVVHRRSSNSYLLSGNAFFRLYESWMHMRMSSIVANSLAAVRELIAEGAPRDRVKLIYNGVDLKKFDRGRGSGSKIRNLLAIGENDVVFVCVANLIPYKAHNDLIRAFGMLRSNCGWHLIIVGGGESSYQAELEALAKEVGISDRVRFIGARRDTESILMTCDVGVLSSQEEGMPNVILEYMAAGLPVVATSVGGVPELVVHGETGYIVPPRDYHRFYEAILVLMQAPEVRRRLGCAGQLRVRQQFGVDLEVEEYTKLYSTLSE